MTYVLLAAIATAGSLIDTFGGFQLAQGFDPLSMNMNTVFGKLHQMLAVMILFATGGHLLVLGGLLRTFDVLPLGEAPELDGASHVLVTAFGMFFVTAVQIALPADRGALRRRPRAGAADQGRARTSTRST